ncbi:hypothetical protein [Craterilacuibacter sp. RT1T]|uniref:hypothetical protein n=1 Tax=Craterilacuibacter sp. RT1T TaxID=2942211 RepID=UPI0020BE6766|nr:hypothetical protein [Craterilacuibacter sp. RT1T]MCL6263183.1 hypothetical protein [Craterilacuibacter sp. RT1T]
MDLELSKLIFPAIVGLISGALGSIFAPWVHWGIEKKKMARKNREELIKEVRLVLSNEEIESSAFRNHAVYSRIRPYMSEKAKEAVEGEYSGSGHMISEVIVIATGSGRHDGVNSFRNRVLDEISELEKQWGLI